MGKHDLGNKDIHKDADALAVLLNGKVGGGGVDNPIFTEAFCGSTGTSVSPGNGVSQPDGLSSDAGGVFRMPAGKTSVTISAICEPGSAASGNVYGSISIFYGPATGGAVSSDGTTNAAVTVTSGNFVVLRTGTFNVGSDQIVRVIYTRLGAHASDTFTTYIYTVGFTLSYS